MVPDRPSERKPRDAINFEQKNKLVVKSHPKRSESNIARPHKKVNELKQQTSSIEAVGPDML